MSSEVSSPPGDRARLVVIGGFPGAGKTTAIARLSKYLQGRGLKAAAITNDHGSELVDAAYLRAQGLPVEPVEGGDLCIRAEETFQAVARLRNDSNASVIIAEPVGTSFDLARTILLPARLNFGAELSVAPLSVMIDPVRASRVLGLESGGTLAREIASLYRAQLAEAEIVIINKSDLLSEAGRTALISAIQEVCPAAKIFSVSAKTGEGLGEWFACLMEKDTAAQQGSVGTENVPDAFLAWLNCTVSVSSIRYFDGGKLLLDLATCIQSLFQQEGGELAHLKIALKPEHDGNDLGAVSLDRHDASPQLLRDVSEPVQRGELILNARAEGDPEMLHSTVNRALLALMDRSLELFARMNHCEHFKSGPSRKPQPVPG